MAPPPGFMMMEGDFCQAELFTMANVSGDKNMIRLLTTPGLDLHDSTTLSSFNMKMLDEKDNEVTEDDLVKLAAEIGADSEEFQHYMKVMRYLQVDGRIITRAQFKSGPRISAKSLNFGIPLKNDKNDQLSIAEVKSGELQGNLTKTICSQASKEEGSTTILKWSRAVGINSSKCRMLDNSKCLCYNTTHNINRKRL